MFDLKVFLHIDLSYYSSIYSGSVGFDWTHVQWQLPNRKLTDTAVSNGKYTSQQYTLTSPPQAQGGRESETRNHLTPWACLLSSKNQVGDSALVRRSTRYSWDGMCCTWRLLLMTFSRTKERSNCMSFNLAWRIGLLDSAIVLKLSP